ncbi:MAG: ABC transporter ATP-binding protein [Saprospiraceae bacterium]|nr:ABC transporter ATP-binding protein [Saprospiraceae bacterium]
MSLLDVRNLEVIFEGTPRPTIAVAGISFTIGRGERLGLVGESGSGKSITALSIMRLIDFEPGEKTIRGSVIYQENDQLAIDLMAIEQAAVRPFRGKKMAMIFQEPMQALNPVLRCGKQVEEAVCLHQGISGPEARKAVLDLLVQVQLTDPERIYQSYPFQLSGGQKQRILIAIALAGKPELLIADEPTTALDVHVQKGILELLESLRQQYNMSLLFISHDLGVIASICDRVLVMKDGHIVESGLVKTIFESPQHPYTRGLLACRPRLGTKPNRLPELKDFAPDKTGHTPELKSVLDRIGAAPAYAIPDQQPILEVEGLAVYFSGPRIGLFSRKRPLIKAVDEVNFQIFPGETIGLVGASGSGKTTLGRSLVGLLPLQKGRIRFRGKDISGLEKSEWQEIRRDLQMVFQDPYASLNPRKSIGEAIREPLEVHGIIKDRKAQQGRVVELLEWVGLEAGHYHRYPHAFSGGQRQRICIARALALEPDFLICDESVSALDVSIQAQVLNLLKDLQERLGFSCVFISHDLAVVNFIADRVFVMDAGRIVEQGFATEIYRHPKSGITKRLIEASLF